MVGKKQEGKESLTPVSHGVQNAHIEITIDTEGIFQKAYPIAKAESKTIIPVTIESANRTGDNTKAHPLCDQLRYLAPFGGNKFTAYVAQLEKWANSEFSHSKVTAILHYIQGETILTDLADAGVITLDEQGIPDGGKIEGTMYSKCLVRWQVIPAPDGVRSASWEDTTLFKRYAAFYAAECAEMHRDICLVSGKEDIVCEMHPKGVVAINYGAKLVSANDDSGFTYRGRFTQAHQAYCLGYTASQKAHHALHWIAANEGVIFGGRTFLCWNPDGAPVPTTQLFGLPSQQPVDFVGYKKQLLQTLGGYRQALKDTDDVVIAAMDAATTGRLSVTYYNELKASDFLDRIEYWYQTFCWESRRGIQAPSLKRIVDCAYGTQKTTFIEADEHVLRDHVQRLLHCIIDKQPLPLNLVQALVSKASTPLAYQPTNREMLLITACAVVRKYRNDKKEEWTLALDTSNNTRSYLFGRLLAIAEHVERSTYSREESREPNAIRMQTVFSNRPLYAWRILEEKLNPYFMHLPPGLRAYYKNLTGEIVDRIIDTKDSNLNKKLADTYLLGYYHQRSYMTRKKDASKEENEHESVEE